MGNKSSRRKKPNTKKSKKDLLSLDDFQEVPNDATPVKDESPSAPTASNPSPSLSLSPSPAPSPSPSPSPPSPSPSPSPSPPSPSSPSPLPTTPASSGQTLSQTQALEKHQSSLKKYTEIELEKMIHSQESFKLPDDESIVKECQRITQWKEIEEVEDLGNCTICMCELDENIVQLSQCVGHQYHKSCIIHCFSNNFLKCPICKFIYGVKVGKMPKGEIAVTEHTHAELPLAGYPSSVGTIKIVYNFKNGIQGPEHPSPGSPYTGTNRIAYLPNNQAGKEVLELLRIAWERNLTFTVGSSVTTGVDNCVIWNGVHHKTALSGGPTNYGYPDEGYFDRVKQELKDLGVVLPVNGSSS